MQGRTCRHLQHHLCCLPSCVLPDGQRLSKVGLRLACLLQLPLALLLLQHALLLLLLQRCQVPSAAAVMMLPSLCALEAP
jgi:hypothetical protein